MTRAAQSSAGAWCGSQHEAGMTYCGGQKRHSAAVEHNSGLGMSGPGVTVLAVTRHDLYASIGSTCTSVVIYFAASTVTVSVEEAGASSKWRSMRRITCARPSRVRHPHEQRKRKETCHLFRCRKSRACSMLSCLI